MVECPASRVSRWSGRVRVRALSAREAEWKVELPSSQVAEWKEMLRLVFDTRPHTQLNTDIRPHTQLSTDYSQ